MCTSTMGSCDAFKASRIAIEVNEYAAGLKTIPAMVLRAS